MTMVRTMMDAGGRRSGRTGRPDLTAGWRASRGAPDGRAALLAALADYRQGVAEAPVVCKWGTRILRQAQDERGMDSCFRRNDGVSRRNGSGGEGWSVEEAVVGPLVFVASTGEVDRHGDTVAPEGWRLDAYRDNPVVLWAHDYGEPAIGRAEAVWSDGRALRARLEFAPTEFAGQVERLYRQGYQRGVSVGFRPLRFEERRDPVNGAFLGIRFLEQELLEISAVPVPANGGALLAEETMGSTAAPAETGRALDEVVGLLRGLRRAWMNRMDGELAISFRHGPDCHPSTRCGVAMTEGDFWIPAFAGMTGFGTEITVERKRRLQRYDAFDMGTGDDQE